jgi:CBS domain-containing protein
MPPAIYYADKKPVLIDKNASLLTATRYLLNNNRYHAVLVEDGNKLAGVLSIRDVAKALFIIGEEAVELIEAGYLAKTLENPAYFYATKDVIYITENENFESALEIMVKNNIGSLPIIDSKRTVIGILEEKQVIKAMPIYTKKSMCEYASWELILIEEEDEILEAIGLMVTNNIRRIVITNKDGEPIGMTTLNILIDYLTSPSSLDKLLEGDESPLSKPVKKVMLKPWITDCSYSLREIASLLTFDPLGAVLVKDDDKYGIITERDLLRALRDSFSS